MEKKILKELQNITKELKVIGKNTKKDNLKPILAEGLAPLDFNTEQLNKEKEEVLIYDQDDAVEFIHSRLAKGYSKEIVRQVLDLEEEYMRSVGII